MRVRQTRKTKIVFLVVTKSGSPIPYFLKQQSILSLRLPKIGAQSHISHQSPISVNLSNSVSTSPCSSPALKPLFRSPHCLLDNTLSILLTGALTSGLTWFQFSLQNANNHLFKSTSMVTQNCQDKIQTPFLSRIGSLWSGLCLHFWPSMTVTGITWDNVCKASNAGFGT